MIYKYKKKKKIMDLITEYRKEFDEIMKAEDPEFKLVKNTSGDTFDKLATNYEKSIREHSKL